MALPDSISGLVGLVTLNLESCQKLTTLPPALCAMPALECVTLAGCFLLSGLPPAFGALARLRELSLKDTTPREYYTRGITGIEPLELNRPCLLEGTLLPGAILVSPARRFW